jgi:predicted alpha-1,2-mannosidase
MSRRLILFIVLVLLTTTVPAAAQTAPPSPADEVDPFIGTFAPGFVVPGAATPFGMVQLSPDTEGPFAYSGYLWSDKLIKSFSLLHLSGPGVKKAGDIPLLPTVGPVVSSDQHANASSFNHAAESAEPGYYQVALERYATNVELTAAPHTGVMRATFPPTAQANILLDVARSIEGIHDGGLQVVGNDEVVGWARGRYPVFFAAKFSRPFASSGTWLGSALTPGGKTVEGRGAGGWVTFDATTQRAVTVKVGVSLVDIDGARANRDAEVAGFDFDAVRTAARRSWNDELSRIRIDGGLPTDRTGFYTALYHSLLHPNIDSDVDGRYRGPDGAVHQLPPDRDAHYANFSSWDTYKAQNQLLATLVPGRYREMLLSLLDFARQGGKLPRWGEWNRDSSHMSGDPVIPMVADGYCRGVFEPTDPVADLYAEMAELADVHREPSVRSLGYLPTDVSDRGAGTTLEYGVADFALGLMGSALGTPDAQRRLDDSLRYRTLMDPQTGWIRPRASDGAWRTPFDPTEEEGFQEGNSWQYSWLAPHDAAGVFTRMGGVNVARQRLDNLFRFPAEVNSRLNVFGLVYRTDTYAPGNEHDLQIPWLYAFAGQPARGAAALRDIHSLFRAAPDGLPGNDDLGSLSAWHVLSALGLGSVTPGAPLYVIGSPQFPQARIALPGGRAFTISAPDTSLVNKYVTAATVDGKPLDRAWFTHDVIASGRTLHLTMGASPSTWGTTALPPSLSTSPLSAFGCAPA